MSDKGHLETFQETVGLILEFSILKNIKFILRLFCLYIGNILTDNVFAMITHDEM